MTSMKNGLQFIIEGYFFGALLSVSIPVGAIGIRLVHSLTGGQWGNALKKYYLVTSRSMPLAFILWLPVFFCLPLLYIWTTPQDMARHSLQHKTMYLDSQFFIARSVFYFIVWTGTVYWLDHHNKKYNLAGFLSVLYVFTGSFAAFDWVMSLIPGWYSSIFGIMFVTGQVLLSLCFMVMVLSFVNRKTKPSSDNSQTFIDLGSLMLTILMLWAYMTFSQFLIIWMGNIPEEISWYLAGIRNGWEFMPFIIISGHFFVPFFLLLKRSWKKRPVFLAALSAFIILMRLSDIGWMVFPGLQRGVRELTMFHFFGAITVTGIYLIKWIKDIQKYQDN